MFAADKQEPAWLPSADGLWLTLELPLTEGSGALAFGARLSREPNVDAKTALAIAQMFAATYALQDAAAQRIASYQAALDRSEVGIIMIGCDHKLIFANDRAETLLDAGDYLRRRNGGVGVGDFRDALKLQVAIDHVCTAEGDQVEDPVVAVQRRHPLRPLLICVSPASIVSDTVCDAGAILRIFDPDRDLRAHLEPVCALYHLTPVETRLACEIARGATLDAAGAALRIKPQTVRSYLKQIFLKTDTNRQSDLIRLLLASTVRAAPVAGFRVV